MLKGEFVRQKRNFVLTSVRGINIDRSLLLLSSRPLVKSLLLQEAHRRRKSSPGPTQFYDPLTGQMVSTPPQTCVLSPLPLELLLTDPPKQVELRIFATLKCLVYGNWQLSPSRGKCEQGPLPLLNGRLPLAKVPSARKALIPNLLPIQLPQQPS